MARKWLLAVPPIAVLGLGTWAFYWEPSSLQVHRFELTLPGWPAEQDGLTVALLSDLHVGSPYYDTEKLEAVVRSVNENHPDLVLLAGDYVIAGVRGGTFVEPEKTASLLKGLEAPLGVYAVLGNHDWWFDGPRVRKALEAENIPVLEDERRPIRGGGHDFWLVGLSDWWECRPRVERILDEVPVDGRPILAFTHNPDLFPHVPPRVTLTLAGHTHGGQVRFPFIGAPIVPSGYGERYAHGLVVERDRRLFVTSGLGTSILPVRFRVPPEIAVLTLTHAH
jgi:predicted MPP superfamily phosphohydrolase